MGRLWDLIQEFVDAQPFEVRDADIARRLGVAKTTVKNWRQPKSLVDKEHLVAIAELTRVPYHRVLDALLEDIGYLYEEDREASG
jgi:transcriptional regulator with XRE-family HTH domain